MKILVFATCILAAITVGDAMIIGDNIIKTDDLLPKAVDHNIINDLLPKTIDLKDLLPKVVDLKDLLPKAVDLKDLINFHMTFAQCVVKLGLLKIASPEIPFCVAEKKNLLDEEGGIKWDDTLDYIMTIMRDPSKIDKIKEILQKCKEEGDNFEGSKKEKSLKSMECGTALIKVIGRKLIFL